MAKKNTKKRKKEEYQSEEVFQNLDEFAQKTESFFEKHAKTLAAVFGGLIVIALAYFAYLKYVSEPKNNEAYLELAEVQRNFVQDSLDMALGNEVSGASYLATEKSDLKAGKVAASYAGKIEFDKGNYEKALEYYQKFSSDDDIANSKVKIAIGDCYVELQNYDQAMASYKAGFNDSENAGVKLIAEKKATILALETKNTQEAIDMLTIIKEKYSDFDNTGFADMYLPRLKNTAQDGNQ